MSLRMRVKLNGKCLKNLIIALGVCLTSCTNDFLPELSLDTVSIYTDTDANENSATAVDLVIVYDQELEKSLGKLSAAKYFSSSKQLLLDNPTLLDIWHWELVPGQIVQDFTPPQEQGDAYAAYVFANYLTPGDHRLKVAPSGVVKILLQRKDLINLVAFDVHEVRTGVTMSSDSTKRGEEEDEDDEDESPQIKLGPTKDISAPCKKVAPPPKKQDEMCTPAPQANITPIEAKPLCPPKSIVAMPSCLPKTVAKPLCLPRPAQAPHNICPPKLKMKAQQKVKPVPPKKHKKRKPCRK